MGDPVFEAVTEGRYKQWLDAKAAKQPWALHMVYSCCGDLVHYMLRCLGCRDETLVNRNDDGGTHPWAGSKNITDLEGHPCTWKPDGDEARVPRSGDAVFINNQYGGHVFVVDQWPMEMGGGGAAADHEVSQEYGQPAGKQRVRTITQNPLAVDGHSVGWWLNLDLVPLTESAIVPDDFEGGIPDENPYAEPGVTP